MHTLLDLIFKYSCVENTISMIKFKHSGDKEANNLNICILQAWRQAKGRGTQSMLVLFFTELEASCSNYALLWTSSFFSYKPLVIVRSLASISKSFEFESHLTAYSSASVINL